jgi:hypothetical protein
MSLDPRKAIAAALLLAITLTGCQPIDDGKPTNPKPTASAANRNPSAGKNQGGFADYSVIVTAVDAAHPELERVSRILVCNILGLDASGLTVTLEDARTGRSGEYAITIDKNTPARLLLYGARGLAVLQVTCVMFGNPGDSILCEFLDSRGRPAPMVFLRDHGMVGKHSKSARCLGYINAAA